MDEQTAQQILKEISRIKEAVFELDYLINVIELGK